MRAAVTQPVTIVMYHYVRDLARSAYPRIKGLTVDRFRHQLDYIDRYYQVVRMEDVLAAVTDRVELPRNAMLLTFDDGFRDHYETVTPLLEERGWQGSFFPCTQPIVDARVLDVHKIHFVLATVEDPRTLLGELTEWLRGTASAPRVDEVHRFDDAAVTTFKRLLQRELPLPLRSELVDRFFRTYVTADEAAFARELYASADELRDMRRRGMYLGCHGHRHVWLDRLGPVEAGLEIQRSLAAWDGLGLPLTDWVMCYPYGGFDETLAPVLRDLGCALGLLAEPEIADLGRHDRFALPRLDTNDLPQTPTDRPNRWTTRIVAPV